LIVVIVAVAIAAAVGYAYWRRDHRAVFYTGIPQSPIPKPPSPSYEISNR